MIDKIDLNLFKRIIHEGRHNPDLLDSYSINQFRAKERLINHVEFLGIDENSEIVIMGGWYGSIFLPAFRHVKKITLIDKDKEVINTAENRLFYDYKNVKFRCQDLFDDLKHNEYRSANLFINTSCEHMAPMKEWPMWEWICRKNKPYFAFTSNDMFDIEGHINCVNNIEEFKKQLPDNAKVMIEDEIKDERGTRFLVIGKLK